LQVLHTPGHSPGGISLYEAATETLFSGDIIYDGPLIEDAYHSNLTTTPQPATLAGAADPHRAWRAFRQFFRGICVR
jgi:glyoxylase-like metal-dependent hydrolase (beta-lactamase superfamily II)